MQVYGYVYMMALKTKQQVNSFFIPKKQPIFAQII